ncbi:MAG: SDR family oxidoreductase [Deltaproteobacteria bacterium]|nr:SDR family oxidoreductase [Deltaproteobacteria bacterium]
MKLADRIAVVTGASRGAGRGVAVELGAAGATVYVTGRSTRGTGAPPAYGRFLEHAGMAAMPGTIDDTADAVTAAGGRGIAVPCDHSDPEQVGALFARVEREHGRLDVLVNNAWGGHESFTVDTLSTPFWEQPLSHWDAMFDRGVRNHLLACRAAAPLLVRQRRGLIAATTFWDRGRYLQGNLYYDVAKAALNRIAFGVAEELRPHGVTSLALSPGWMRTELILAAFKTDEDHWRDVPPLARTESPRYLGRAVVALAADPAILAKSGGVYAVGDLAVEYGFTDIDGRVVPPFEMPSES